jgi:hypothetical protein
VAKHDREFTEKQAERDRRFKESAERDEMVLTLAPQPPPGALLPRDVLEALELPESVVMSITRLWNLFPMPCQSFFHIHTRGCDVLFKLDATLMQLLI